jgi:uncharacterized LabA/DUF88 family protein
LKIAAKADPSIMLVLADYDNIDPLIRARGMGYIIERVVSSISQIGIAVQPRIDVRLYGGWFDGSRLSKVGQSISSEIRGLSQKRFTLPWSGEVAPVSVVTNSQLALGLEAAQQLPLHHTFRRRSFQGRLYFQNSNRHLCHVPACPLDLVDQFITNQRCPEIGCSARQEDVLFRNEQKLVDTMLVSDLIYWASRPNHPILAVLSSDDDMWPGIRTAIAFGHPIIQIHTSPSPSHSSYVGRLGNEAYIQTNI